MPNQNITLKIIAEPLAVTAGRAVKLRVATSVDAAELAEQDFNIDFEVIGLPSGGTQPEKITFTEGLWRTPAEAAQNVYRIVAKLTEPGAGRAEIGRAESDVTVIAPATIDIQTDPAAPVVVKEGAQVKLEAILKMKPQCPQAQAGAQAVLSGAELKRLNLDIKFDTENVGHLASQPADRTKVRWDTSNVRPGVYTLKARLLDRNGTVVADDGGRPLKASEDVTVEIRPLAHQDTIPVSLKRTAVPPTADQALWVAIRNRTKAIAFSGSGYKDFIDRVLCKRVPIPAERADKMLTRQLDELRSDIYGMAAYDLLKTATEVFLLINCGVKIEGKDPVTGEALYDASEEANDLGETLSLDEISERLRVYLGEGRLPYIDRVLRDAFSDEAIIDRFYCEGVLRSRIESPCLLELIWSYWHEEGMLVQTLNAISLRFQNKASAVAGRDPLAHMEIDPLRPLNNLLWGYIQDEQNRLTVARRAYEYDHHYGLALYGKAVPRLQAADSRSKFLEAFHNLLHLCTIFFQQDDDTTVISDGFPVLNALKEVHLLLAQGAHNQFGDLPWTARSEMLIQQWLLARPEMRDFLQSRHMVPYKEPWMGEVDTMKKLQGWTDVTVTHFHDLAVFGEQLLLSTRYGDWIDITDQEFAKNWARYWRSEIQGYIHAYRAATGVDLTQEPVDSTMPSVLLLKRLQTQRGGSTRAIERPRAASPAMTIRDAQGPIAKRDGSVSLQRERFAGQEENE